MTFDKPTFISNSITYSLGEINTQSLVESLQVDHRNSHSFPIIGEMIIYYQVNGILGMPILLKTVFVYLRTIVRDKLWCRLNLFFFCAPIIRDEY